jgi:hypothetical protein
MSRSAAFGWFVFGLILSGSAVGPASAQSREEGFEIGAHAAMLRLSEFDATDAGVGLNVAWRATPIVALDGAVTWFPGSDAASASARISNQTRVLGLAGARTSVRRGALELFARGRVGFMRFAPLDRIVCIAVTIVPLPLECLIATGHTAFAADLGGGVVLNHGDRLQIRVEAGDLMVRYGV